MRRSCKHTDITNPKVIRPWVMECLRRHYRRYDFRKLLLTTGGLSRAEYDSITDTDRSMLVKASYTISEEAARRIRNRHLMLSPVHIGRKIDVSTGKERLIGKESAMQQVLDHIAVGSCEPIFRRRIVLQQASSIKGRGQAYGVSMISKWVRDDKRAADWASRHKRTYYRRTKYYVKLDVKKCYPSCRVENFMRLFRRDCANEDILWLWEALLNSHHVKIDGKDEVYQGFMIGALPSQWACQYMLSYAYRYVMSLHKERRNKKQKLVSHMLIFMDDMYMCGSNRKDLKTATYKLILYVRDELGLTAKPSWHILNIDETPVDMMGFRVHADGNITVRPRVFLRARRMMLRAMRKGISKRQAQRILSYKGFFAQNQKKIRNRNHKYHILSLRTARMRKKLHMKQVFKRSARMMRRKEVRP